MIVNIYGPNTGAPRHIRQVLYDLQGDLDSHTIIVGDFNTLLSLCLNVSPLEGKKLGRDEAWDREG